MSKYCINCGSSMDDNAFICPNCGALPSVEPVQTNAPVVQTVEIPAAPSSVPMKAPSKIKWWMVAVPAVLIVAVTLLFTWQTLLMMFAPQAALRFAMDKTMQSVSSRYEGSPMSVLFTANPEAEFTQTRLNADVNYAGNAMEGKLVCQSNLKNKQHTLSAAFSMAGQTYGGAFYMDPDFAAASLDFFNDGAYYGITFESFKDDAAKSILSDFMTPEQIEALDNMIQSLVGTINREYDPEMGKPYAEVIEDFIANLELAKDSVELTSEGKICKCDTITYHAEKEAIISLCETLIGIMEEDENFKSMLPNDTLSDFTDETIPANGIELLRNVLKELKKGDIDFRLVYYVYNGRLIQTDLAISMVIEGEALNFDTQVHYGLRADSDLSCRIIVKANGEELVVNITSSVVRDEGSYSENLIIIADVPDNEPVSMEILTSWNKETGKLSANLALKSEENKEYTFTCSLKQLENGYEISIDHKDVSQLLEAADIELPEDLTFFISLTVTNEAEITKPEYTNLDKWDAPLVQQLQQAIMSQFGGAFPADAA